MSFDWPEPNYQTSNGDYYDNRTPWPQDPGLPADQQHIDDDDPFDGKSIEEIESEIDAFAVRDEEQSDELRGN